MNHIFLGLICGFVFGLIDALIMLPMKFDDKRKKLEAISSAFLERFFIGFIIPNANFGLPSIVSGGLIGLAFSLPTSIITRAYLPINIIGFLGGLIIGFISGKF